MLVGILSILAAAGLTLVDQLIKLWATVELLPVGSKPFIPHVLEFYYLLNDGMSFSMLSGKRTLLVIVTGDRPYPHRRGGGLPELPVHQFPSVQFCGCLHLCRRGPAGPQPAAGYAPRTKSKTAKGECAHRWNSVN